MLNKPIKDVKDEQFLRLTEAEEEQLLIITISIDETTDNPNIQTFLEEIRQLYYRVFSLAVSFKCTLTLNLSHIQQICSRRLWKHSNNNMENLCKWRHAYWIELKTLCQKEKLLVLSNFTFVTKSSKLFCCRGVRKQMNSCRS